MRGAPVCRPGGVRIARHARTGSASKEYSPTMDPLSPARSLVKRRTRGLDFALWALVAFGICGLLIAYITPFELRDPSDWFSGLMWTAFLIRTVSFHAGWFVTPFVLLAAWRRRFAVAGVL